MAFGWLKKILGKSSKNNDMQIDSVYENPFYEVAETETLNPFYNDEDDLAPSYAGNAAAYSNEGTSESVSSAIPEYEIWQMQNIGGLPTVESIEKMAGGLKMDKIGKHKNVKKALDALGNYQRIMEESHSVSVDDQKIRFAAKSYNLDSGEKMFDVSSADEAVRELGNFILCANKMINGSKGLFSSRSSNVQKLVPIFANLLVQANGILPKLVNLETVVAPYVIATDKTTFTYSELISHSVTGSRSGGLATRGLEKNNGSIDLSPEKVLETLNEKDGDVAKRILVQRREKTELARMKMKIPLIPVGVLKEQKIEAASEEQIQKLKNSASSIADAYFAELRPLMTALDDTVESYETNEGEDRLYIHGEQAKLFRISKCIQQVLNDKEALMSVIINGLPNNGNNESVALNNIRKMYSFGGGSLETAAEFLNLEATYSKNFTRLVDSEGNTLTENSDFKIGGGAASISILDFKNKKVLRAPKTSEGKYLSDEEQKSALNGIYDEAISKVSQFLGFNVVANAEAGGFFSREKGSTDETAIFGGSVMEMANGKTGNRINVTWESQIGSVAQNRNKADYQKLDIAENGRFIGDMMKMNVVDYITMHADRHDGNFMIDVKADENESMIKAIDNDMIFGYAASSAEQFGYQSSFASLKSINNRSNVNHNVQIKAVLPMVTDEIKAAFEALDLDKFNEMLMPYVDRVQRMAAVHRAAELKEYVKTVKSCDLSTPEGVQEYMYAAARSTMDIMTKGIYRDKEYGLRNTSLNNVPNMVIRMLADSYKSLTGPGGITYVVKTMKLLGLSKSEAETMLYNNITDFRDTNQKIDKTYLDSQIGYIMQDYDLPLDEFRKKYKFN